MTFDQDWINDTPDRRRGWKQRSAVRLARRSALLEAADIADQHASVEGIAQRISAQIRALAEEEK